MFNVISDMFFSFQATYVFDLMLRVFQGLMFFVKFLIFSNIANQITY